LAAVEAAQLPEARRRLDLAVGGGRLVLTAY
jgi:hypothetical protein